MWETPYSQILQLMHAEMAANGVETVSNGPAPDIEAIKNREFDLSKWQ